MSVPEPDIDKGFHSIEIYSNLTDAYKALDKMPPSQRRRFTSLGVQSYGGGYAIVARCGENRSDFPVSVDELLRQEFAQYASQSRLPGSEHWVKQQWVEGRKRDGLPVPEGW